jgi:hypothetical protein
MPRPRVFRQREVVAFALEAEHAALLRELARREGVSLSELLRRVVLRWLEEEAGIRCGMSLAAPAGRAGPGPAAVADELDRAEVEDLLDAVRRLHAIVPAQGTRWGGRGPSHDVIMAWRRRWYELKRWLRHLEARVADQRLDEARRLLLEVHARLRLLAEGAAQA